MAMTASESRAAAREATQTPRATDGLIGSKVAYIQSHIGIMINHQALSGIHHEKHACEMTLTPSGVLVVFQKTPSHRNPKRFFVPFTNIESVELCE